MKINRKNVLDTMARVAEGFKADFEQSSCDHTRVSARSRVFGIELLAIALGLEDFSSELEKWRDSSYNLEQVDLKKKIGTG